jgi:hypothetical protein
MYKTIIFKSLINQLTFINSIIVLSTAYFYYRVIKLTYKISRHRPPFRPLCHYEPGRACEDQAYCLAHNDKVAGTAVNADKYSK